MILRYGQKGENKNSLEKTYFCNFRNPSSLKIYFSSVRIGATYNIGTSRYVMYVSMITCNNNYYELKENIIQDYRNTAFFILGEVAILKY